MREQHAMSCGIILRDRKLLLMRRNELGVWGIPCGGVEFGESPEETVVREMKEETGLDVAPKEILCMLSLRFKDDLTKMEKHLIGPAYVCETGSYEIKMNEENTDYKWVSFEEAMKIGFNEVKGTDGKYSHLAHGTDTVLKELKKRNLID